MTTAIGPNILAARLGQSRAVERAIQAIPSHWTVARFKAVTRPREERNADGLESMLSLTITGNLIDRSETGGRQEPAEANVPKYLVARPGDLVVNPMWLTGGSIGVSAVRGAVSPDYRVFEIRGHMHPRYVHALLRSKPYSDQYRLYTRSNTTFDRRITQDDLDNLPIPVPPLDEQRRIADFLDAETAQIEALIAEQEHFIALLRERRAGVIADIIGGSNAPKVPLKRMLSGIDQGVSPQADAYLANTPGSWGVLKSGCVNHGVFRQAEHKRLADDFVIDARHVVRMGDLIVTRASGSPDLVGSTALVERLDYNLILSDKLFRLNPGPSTESRFLRWVLNSADYRRQVRRSISGAEGLANNLPLSSLRNFRVPLSALEDQRRVSDQLDTATSRIDALIAEAGRNILLSTERRSALITAAVTGQMDVRTGRTA